MKRIQKEEDIKEIKKKLENSKATIVTEYKGLNVEKITKLRKNIKKSSGEYKVYKNTLLNLAYKELGYESMEKYFTGSTAVAFGSDPVALAKVISEFKKQEEIFNIKCGTLGHKIITNKDIAALATLPSREVLLGILLGTMNAPITGFLTVLNGTVRNFCYALKAIAENKEKAA